MSWLLQVRDSTLAAVAEVDDYQSLDMTLRFNDVSSWVLSLPADSFAASQLEFGGGLIAKRNGETILSGPVVEIERSWDQTSGVERIKATGVDDVVFLRDRLALPVVTGPPYTAQAHDVRTGAAETVMKAYVEYNAGPSAQVARRVTGLTVAATAGLGTTVTGYARFDNLLALVQYLALAGGDLGFRLIQSGSGLVFSVYDPTDKTATVIFSKDLGNLRAYRYTDYSSTGNYVIAAGQGDLTARTFRESGDAGSISTYGRKEVFRDARDTNDTTVLDQRIAETLASTADKRDLSVTPIDTEAVSFLADYELGDIVTVRAGDVTIQDVVREVRLVVDQNGESVVPAISSPERPKPLEVMETVDDLDERVGNLERNK